MTFGSRLGSKNPNLILVSMRDDKERMVSGRTQDWADFYLSVFSLFRHKYSDQPEMLDHAYKVLMRVWTVK
ncbi:hypothetical protein QEH42_gp206 [Microbacterium phage Pumpernickel]|uniref:Uncharacterized protein n=1 Tax=Microbacterium phage Pumpernickel TaxID=2885983 RepID=A0AAE8Y7V6_9CAUD|nr:hypothetical protein QEH42_gp206 [Microbacterium phage Pumpernickel]UDL16012.1 hypothetical protein SEA_PUMPERNICKEL_262 [Microbacterium phage Pumpernickel]